MAEINKYCSLIDEDVIIDYHERIVPILGKGSTRAGISIDECSHSDHCNARTRDCPVFQELNSI